MFSYKEFWDALKVQAAGNKKFSLYFKHFLNRPSEEMASCNLTTGSVSLSMNANMKQRYLWVQLLFENQDYRHCGYFVRNFDSISKLFPGEVIETNRAVSPTAFGIKYTGIALTDTRRWYEYCEFFINHAVLLQQMYDKCDCGYLRDEFPQKKFQAILDECNGVSEQETSENVPQELQVSEVPRSDTLEATQEVKTQAAEAVTLEVSEEVALSAEPDTEAVLQEAAAEDAGKVSRFFSRLIGKAKDEQEPEPQENTLQESVPQESPLSEEAVVNEAIEPVLQADTDTAAVSTPVGDDGEALALENQADSNLLLALSSLDFKDANENFTYAGKPKEKAEPMNIRGYRIYPRSTQTAVNALAKAHFMCELDEDHTTFIRRSSGKMYTEPMHLIPMSYADRFDVSIDTEENIVSLCCNCYNQIRFGKSAEAILKKLYNLRKEALKQAGISITLEELMDMYGL